MKLFEIDYNETDEYIMSKLSDLYSQFVNNTITKEVVIRQAEELNRNLETELNLSDLDLSERAKYSSILILISIFVTKINQM